MLYTTWKVGEEEYKLRLAAKSIVELEKKLGGNPLDIFMGIENNKLPSMEEIILVFHASMQKYQSNIKLDDVYDIYDEYIEKDGSFMELIPILLEVFKVSGFFKESDVKQGEAKN